MRFRQRKARRRPLLTPQHEEKRIAFAKQHLLQETDFSKIVFSDEKKFRMDGPDGWNYDWHELGTKDDSPQFSKDYGRYKGVMVWMGISAQGILHLERVTGTLDAFGYTLMLEGDALARIHRAHGTDFVFQQDNAPAHRAAYTVDALAEDEIETMAWPPLSPDLNPVENVWATLARRVYADGRVYESEDALWTAIQKEAARIPPSDIAKLIHGMRKRMVDVLTEQGRYIQ
jgi:hypothetical protein